MLLNEAHLMSRSDYCFVEYPIYLKHKWRDELVEYCKKIKHNFKTLSKYRKLTLNWTSLSLNQSCEMLSKKTANKAEMHSSTNAFIQATVADEVVFTSAQCCNMWTTGLVDEWMSPPRLSCLRSCLLLPPPILGLADSVSALADSTLFEPLD